MRISDWSSDVCSSDLGRDRTQSGGMAATDRHHDRACRPFLAGRRLSSGILGGRRPAQSVLHRAYPAQRSEEHTSELQSLMRISYAVFCLKKKKTRLILSQHHLCMQVYPINNKLQFTTRTRKMIYRQKTRTQQ